VTPLRRLAPLVEAGLVLALAHVPGARAVVPGLGVFTGGGGALLLGVALLVVLLRSFPRPPRAPRLPSLALFLVSSLLLSAVGLRYVRAVEASGDEIDYLMMAQSLWREGDLDLRDNFARGDHEEFLGGLDRMPGGARRADGRPYPTHSPGLPLLIAPAYALAGRAGSVVLLALLASGLGLLVRDLARRAGADEGAAFVAWAAATGPPVLFYTAFLYTEVPAAFALALALRLLLASPGPLGAAGAALALSALPWLHLRLSLAAAAAGAYAAVRLRGRTRAAFVLVAGAMALVYAAHQYAVFESLSPWARYRGSIPGPMTRATPLRTLVGLFVDGSYGLLPYAPVFLLALAGLPLLLRRGRADRWAFALVFAAVLLPVLSWRNWWGFSPPARFTVPFVPVLALAVAARVAAGAGHGLARWRFALLAVGLGLSLWMFAEPRAMRMVNGRDGPPQVFSALGGETSLARYLPYPSSRAGSTAPPWEPPSSEARVAGVWVAALAALVLLDRRALRGGRADRWFGSLLLPVALFLAVTVAVDRWARPGGAPVTRPTASAS
jgi:hypothetical protein